MWLLPLRSSHHPGCVRAFIEQQVRPALQQPWYRLCSIGAVMHTLPRQERCSIEAAIDRGSGRISDTSSRGGMLRPSSL